MTEMTNEIGHQGVQDLLNLDQNGGWVGLKPPALLPDCVSDRPAVGWRDALVKHFGEHFSNASWKRKVRLGASCSGTLAPSRALRLVGVPVAETVSSDVKRCVLQLIRNLSEEHQPHHHFSFAHEVAANSGYCHLHDRTCDLALTRDDLFVSGFPCSPFSTARPLRWAERWEGHDLAGVMADVADSIYFRQPALVVLENVMGFLRLSRTDL